MVDKNVLTRKDLTEEYREEIRAEIRKSLIYLGEQDVERIERTVKKKMTYLWLIVPVTSIEPKTIVFDDETIVGYKIVVGHSKITDFSEVVRNGETYKYKRMVDIELIVNKDRLQYVLHTYDGFECPDSHYKKVIFEDVEYRKVQLEELNKDDFDYTV